MFRLMSGRGLIIAIDGPSGAGKGTVARALAARLHYRYIDSGAMYRAVAWKAREAGLDLNDGTAVAALAERVTIDLSHGVQVDGEDISSSIRTGEVDRAAATVARHPAVRAVLVQRQRAYGEEGALVMEGRDIGTVVFPHADLKLYLDASPAERALRRARDPAHEMSRVAGSVGTVAEELAARDQSDRTRAASPLVRADDALYIDTTGAPVDQVVNQVLSVVEVRRRAGAGEEPTAT
jgi:cytidylate kinase